MTMGVISFLGIPIIVVGSLGLVCAWLLGTLLPTFGLDDDQA